MAWLSSRTASAIAIDWSGAAKPKRSIWAAVATGQGLEALLPKNNREDAIAWLIEQIKQNPNTIAGLDFSFSMPAWFVRKHGCDNAIHFWAVVKQEGERWLKCCPHPFWGKEGTTKPRSCQLFRETEQVVRTVADPKSTFQIAGGGQVGTGSIRGMPFLTQLRDSGIAVWPFDERKQGQPMVVEIYPRLFTGKVNKSDRSECGRYLEDRHADMEPTLRDRAENREDAFDAAISALRLASAWEATPQLLTNAKLEGQIWHFP